MCDCLKKISPQGPPPGQPVHACHALPKKYPGAARKLRTGRDDKQVIYLIWPYMYQAAHHYTTLYTWINKQLQLLAAKLHGKQAILAN